MRPSGSTRKTNINFNYSLIIQIIKERTEQVPLYKRGSAETDRWKVKCAIGECGMELSTRKINNTPYVVFGFKIEVTRSELKT